MSEKNNDPNFQLLIPKGWQKLPRAVRDAYAKSPTTPPKIRILFYCFQVWDEESVHHAGGQKVAIRQKEIMAGTGLTDDHVNHLIHEMHAQGMIEVREGGRIFPVAQPFLKPLKHESMAAAVKGFWAVKDPDGLKGYMAWEAAGADWKKAFRGMQKRMDAETENAGLEFGPNLGLVGPAPETPLKSVGPPAHIRNRERGEENTPSSSSAVVLEALSQYGTPDDDAVQNLLLKCHAAAPDATADEIAMAVHEKGRQHAGRKNVKNPIGMLLTSVPNALPHFLKELRAIPAEPDLSLWIDGVQIDPETGEPMPKAKGAS
jgi:hypothetical protein